MRYIKSITPLPYQRRLGLWEIPPFGRNDSATCKDIGEGESGGEAATFSFPHVLKTLVIPNATKWSEESSAKNVIFSNTIINYSRGCIITYCY